MKENSLFAFQNGNIDPDESLNYFHANVTKEDAVDKLRQGMDFFWSCEVNVLSIISSPCQRQCELLPSLVVR
jgi:hypothetical protein